MLRRILQLLANERSMRMDELSQTLGARAGELEAMLEKLAQLGYVEDLACRVAGMAGHACARCASRDACAVGSPSHIWALTPKGRHSALNGRLAAGDPPRAG